MASAAESASDTIKLVLLGDSGVGKSTIVNRFVKDKFEEHLAPTVGAGFITHSYTVDSRTVKFQIWDTAGQERYRALAPMYYRGTAAAIVVYDITSMESYKGAEKWVEEMKKESKSSVIVVLCGNKLDLEEQRIVSAAEPRAYCDSNGLQFYEVSAKTGENIREIFKCIANNIKTVDGTTQDSFTEACKLEKEIRQLEEKIQHYRSSNANAKQISQLEVKLERDRDALQKTGRKWEVSKLNNQELDNALSGTKDTILVDGVPNPTNNKSGGGCC